MTVVKNSAWPWLMLASLLLVVGLVVIDGAAGSIILACGFIALFGAGIKLISRNDPTPPEERRPARLGADGLGDRPPRF